MACQRVEKPNPHKIVEYVCDVCGKTVQPYRVTQHDVAHTIPTRHIDSVGTLVWLETDPFEYTISVLDACGQLEPNIDVEWSSPGWYEIEYYPGEDGGVIGARPVADLANDLRDKARAANAALADLEVFLIQNPKGV